MVRRIVGTLILIGREKMSLEEFKNGMDSQTNFKLIGLAPPNGLHLVNIDYPFMQSNVPL